MSNSQRIDPFEVDNAALRLGKFWIWTSRYHADALGFGYQLTPTAPNKYSDLQAAWNYSKKVQLALPISNENADSSVYRSVETNGAFRFVHDVLHCSLGLTFSAEDELTLADIQLESVRGAGFAASSLEHQILHADLVGQIYAVAVNHSFPEDQRRFVIDCLSFGIDEAVNRARAVQL